MHADPLRVSQIVANLLTNAAKYTDPHGRIRLLAALDADDVVIEVSDNGIGIAPESLPARVRHVHAAARHRATARGGLGIGLALTKGLVELHGGSIGVRSEGVGRAACSPCGCRAARRPRPAPPRRRRPRAARRAGAPHPGRRRQPRRRREPGRAAASSRATTCTLAYDGADALLAYERVRPQICLLDIGMPHRTGNEVAAEIRSRADGGLPTLVAITGWGQDADRRQALAAGFDHHLTKPVDPAQLLRLIGEARVGELARA